MGRPLEDCKTRYQQLRTIAKSTQNNSADDLSRLKKMDGSNVRVVAGSNGTQSERLKNVKTAWTDEMASDIFSVPLLSSLSLLSAD
jgi:hypothetical protein